MSTFESTSTTSHPKVRPIHQQRLAYVYVRQSSPKQVAQGKAIEYAGKFEES